MNIGSGLEHTPVEAWERSTRYSYLDATVVAAGLLSLGIGGVALAGDVGNDWGNGKVTNQIVVLSVVATVGVGNGHCIGAALGQVGCVTVDIGGHTAWTTPDVGVGSRATCKTNNFNGLVEVLAIYGNRVELVRYRVGLINLELALELIFESGVGNGLSVESAGYRAPIGVGGHNGVVARLQASDLSSVGHIGHSTSPLIGEGVVAGRQIVEDGDGDGTIILTVANHIGLAGLEGEVLLVDELNGLDSLGTRRCLANLETIPALGHVGEHETTSVAIGLNHAGLVDSGVEPLVGEAIASATRNNGVDLTVTECLTGRLNNSEVDLKLLDAELLGGETRSRHCIDVGYGQCVVALGEFAHHDVASSIDRNTVDGSQGVSRAIVFNSETLVVACASESCTIVLDVGLLGTALYGELNRAHRVENIGVVHAIGTELQVEGLGTVEVNNAVGIGVVACCGHETRLTAIGIVNLNLVGHTTLLFRKSAEVVEPIVAALRSYGYGLGTAIESEGVGCCAILSYHMHGTVVAVVATRGVGLVYPSAELANGLVNHNVAEAFDASAHIVGSSNIHSIGACLDVREFACLSRWVNSLVDGGIGTTHEFVPLICWVGNTRNGNGNGAIGTTMAVDIGNVGVDGDVVGQGDGLSHLTTIGIGYGE